MVTHIRAGLDEDFPLGKSFSDLIHQHLQDTKAWPHQAMEHVSEYFILRSY